MQNTSQHDQMTAATHWQPSDPRLLPGFQAWQAGQWAEARAFFQQFLMVDASNAEAWQGLGSVEWSRGCFLAAEAAFRQALHCACWQAMHWANVGLALRELKRWQAAINVFQVATALDPTYAPAYNEWANVLFDGGRYAEALTLYHQALSLDCSRAVVHHNQGVCYRFLGDLTAARHSFMRALQCDPHYAYTLLELRNLDLIVGAVKK